MDKDPARLKKLECSNLWTEIKELLLPLKSEIAYIRCLGLGSVSSSSSASYQFALLHLMADLLDVNPDKVSLWDPIFDTEDTKIIDLSGFKVSEICTYHDHDTCNVLFYLPHFPISDLESFITTEQPVLVLSNDLTVYTDKYSDLKYLQLYPNCSRLSKIILDSIPKSHNSVKNDGFQIVVNHKQKSAKNRNRKNKLVHTPPIIDYRLEECYFQTVTSNLITSGKSLKNDWDSSFTDLSFMQIQKRVKSECENSPPALLK